ncbi:PREDICTED: probable serine/threonine-protein kinase MARK-A, partial [Rhagoletis zephyria]|uniref:probable serine/threonine-protein kinase MARK-A n=1 Tax=Rhagoletis zephyria TaxID=28612 RepID=UPI0008114EFD
LSSCSSCSGSSSCGRNILHHHHHTHPHPHPHTHLQQHQQHQQQQQQQLQRSCTRCQSFHRHHHRQRRRSSALREDFSSMPTSSNDCSGASNKNNINTNGRGNGGSNGSHTKAVVTFSPPIVAASMNVPPSLSGSMNTISSVPTSLMLGAPPTPADGHSRSAATTPLTTNVSASATNTTKHCSFALTPLIPPPPPPPPRQLSFLTSARFHANATHNDSKAEAAPHTPPTTFGNSMLLPPTTATASAPSLIETVGNLAQSPPIVPLTPLTPSSHTELEEHGKHAPLEAQQSALSQLTTLEDVVISGTRFHANATHNASKAEAAPHTPPTTFGNSMLLPPTTATASAPSLIETVGNLAQSPPIVPLTPLTPSSHTELEEHGKHAPLEAQQSALSQLTTLEDVVISGSAWSIRVEDECSE